METSRLLCVGVIPNNPNSRSTMLEKIIWTGLVSLMCFTFMGLAIEYNSRWKPLWATGYLCSAATVVGALIAHIWSAP